MRRLIVSFAFLLLFPSLVPAAARSLPPTRAMTWDVQRRLDVNNLNLYVSNWGNIGLDLNALLTGA